MVHNGTVASFEPSASWTGLNNLPCRLMAGNDPLVAFWSLTKMLVINASNVGAANSRCLDAQKNLAMTR
jgi:hypothetical protein